jgi:beta-catenin-like protein 1
LGNPRSNDHFLQPKYREEPVEDSREKIMQLVDSLESTSGESDLLDETALKRMILLFEKRALKNQEMRIKFPDSPEKYCSETFVNAPQTD